MNSPIPESVNSLKGDGWNSECQEANSVSDNGFQVSWVGMDRVDYHDEFPTLKKAQDHALSLSECGGHSITVSDDEGNEYDF